jgi:hypothetical protein
MFEAVTVAARGAPPITLAPRVLYEAAGRVCVVVEPGEEPTVQFVDDGARVKLPARALAYHRSVRCPGCARLQGAWQRFCAHCASELST